MAAKKTSVKTNARSASGTRKKSTGRKKGRVELEYYGIDDLNDLLEALAMLRAKQTKTP